MVSRLIYKPAEYGNRIIVGTWAEFQRQIPALPDEPTEQQLEVAGLCQVEVFGPDGQMHAETISALRPPVIAKGRKVAKAYIVTAPAPKRTGTCEVCGTRGELVEREDNSGLTGWVCWHHDALDIVFG